MTFAGALRAYLAGQVALTEKVGDRIYPVVAPPLAESAAGSYPDSLIYRLDGRFDEMTFTPTRQRATRWAIVALSRDHSRAHELAEAVEAALGSFQGDMAGIRVNSSRLAEASDQHDPDFDLYAVEQAYEIVYLTA